MNRSIVTGDDPGGHRLPLEPPWAHGPLSTALLAADPGLDPCGSSGETVVVSRRPTYLTDTRQPPQSSHGRLCIGDCGFLDGRRAVGVELCTCDGSCDADAVVLCAGAIRTPALLLRSGVRVPGLGEHLQDHPAFTLTVSIAAGVDPATTTISVAATHEGFQLLPVERLATLGYAALVVGLTTVASEGRVTIDGAGEPVVELGQLTDVGDLDALVAEDYAPGCSAVGVGGAVRAGGRRGVRRCGGDDARAGAPAARRTGRMGPPTLRRSLPRRRIVPRGRRHRRRANLGYDGLFVADASALPVSRRRPSASRSSAKPNAPGFLAP
ncbi:MAG: GMC family oxidoreductase N-terminal domain-containing protein [Ilumatobacteraceae bacterium]